MVRSFTEIISGRSYYPDGTVIDDTVIQLTECAPRTVDAVRGTSHVFDRPAQECSGRPTACAFEIYHTSGVDALLSRTTFAQWGEDANNPRTFAPSVLPLSSRFVL
jgi:hypothetical protein